MAQVSNARVSNINGQCDDGFVPPTINNVFDLVFRPGFRSTEDMVVFIRIFGILLRSTSSSGPACARRSFFRNSGSAGDSRI